MSGSPAGHTPASRAGALAPGRRVGRYEIIDELGRGGMAVVYLARQLDLDRFVALKQLSAFHAADEEFVHRFLREARLAGSLAHPNIVVIYDAFEHEGLPYLSMEYVSGGSLRPLIGHLTLSQIAGALEGVLAGLAHAEAAGIVHRDLKPENLLVSAEGRLKIADFGIAKAVNRLTSTEFMTRTGTTVGTPAYMAPEQALGRKVSAATDLYATGAIAYELFTGAPPFGGGGAEPMAVMLQHVNDDVPTPVLAVDAPASVIDWILRLLAKEPRDRPASATEAWDALEDIAVGALGPRWRRGARLPAVGQHSPGPTPLTPAAFTHVTQRQEPERVAPAAEDEYESFDWPAPSRPPTDSEAALEPPFSTAPDGAAAGPADTAAPPHTAAPTPAPHVEATPPQPASPDVVPTPATASPPGRADARAPGGVPFDSLAATVSPRQPYPPPPDDTRAWHPPGLTLLFSAVLLLGVVIAIAMFMAGDRPSPTPRSTPAVTTGASNGVVRVTFKPPWREGAPQQIPGLELRRPLGLTRAGDPDGWLVLGLTSATGPQLLPAAFGRRLGPTPPAAESSRLGALSALRYAVSELDGAARPMTVYAAPVTDGVLTVVCGSADRCADVLAGVRLVSGSARAPEASDDFAAPLTKALAALAARRARALDALRDASRRRDQARAAQRVAAAFAAFLDARKGASVGSWDAGASRAIADAAARARRAYDRMATAASRGRERDFAGARTAALAAESRLTQALERLPALGYTLVPPGSAEGTDVARLPRLTSLPRLRPTGVRTTRPSSPEAPAAPAPTAAATAPPTARSTPAAPPPAPTARPTQPPSTDEGGGGGGGDG